VRKEAIELLQAQEGLICALRRRLPWPVAWALSVARTAFVEWHDGPESQGVGVCFIPPTAFAFGCHGKSLSIATNFDFVGPFAPVACAGWFCAYWLSDDRVREGRPRALVPSQHTSSTMCLSFSALAMPLGE